MEPGTIGLIALIETALGVENAFEIATASPRVRALFLGAEDLSADLHCSRTKEGLEILYARTRLVTAAHAAGIDVYDTPFTDVNDDEGIEADSCLARSLGFTGKAAISPRHLDAINRCFSPSQAETDYAREVLAAIEDAKRCGKGAVALRGKMIDAPIAARARQTLAAAEEILAAGRYAAMKESKVVSSLREAIRLSGLQDGMCVSFHHHLRNGDYVVNMVMEQISAMGIRDLTVNASALFDVHLPMLEHIKNGTVSRLLTNYMSAGLGRAISGGVMDQPVEFRTHGGRPRDIAGGETPIDVAFIAAPSSDTMGNCTGKVGKSACGSLGYAFPDAQYAKKVIVITDELVPYPLCGWSIPEIYVDYVVAVDAIGDPAGIVSGTTRMTRNPVAITIAQTAARVIASSGLLKDGFSFQTGAGGASLATAMYLEKIMKQQNIHGSYAQGGITGLLVDMLNEGLFRALLDVQCFDLKAVSSIRENPCHCEVSAEQYASPGCRSAAVDSLDVAVLGATEIDTSFNINVHTDSNGSIMGGSGGHSDAAAGSKLALIAAPLFRGRLPIVRDRVTCISTPGQDVDVLVTQAGVAVNPKNTELRERLRAAGLPVVDIHELKERAERITGVPAPLPVSDRVVAKGDLTRRRAAGHDPSNGQ